MTAQPLAGVRIVVTRARAQASSLVEEIEALGGEAVEVPIIEIVDPLDGGAALRAGLAALDGGDWLVLTSPNGASRVGAVIADAPLPVGVKVAVIGPGTRKRAEAVGLPVDLLPDRSIAEGLLDFIPGPPAGGGRVLLARAEIARATLPDELRRRGWTVDDVAAYRTIGLEVAPDAMVACRHADIAAFTSSSTVTHLVEAVGERNLPPIIACIGPATAATAADHGLRVDLTAPVHTIPGLVEAIAEAVPGLVLIRPEDAAAADSRWLLERYEEEITERFGPGGPGGSSPRGPEDTVGEEIFFVARHAGRPVGCASLTVVAEVADIGRMWVNDAVRGRGVGRTLLRRLVAEARALGVGRVELVTDRSLTAVIALVRAEGFEEIGTPADGSAGGDRWALEVD